LRLSVEGFNVEIFVADPGVVNTTYGESDIVELDGCTDIISGSYGDFISEKFSTAVVAGAGVSGLVGSAFSCECSGSCDSLVSGLEKSNTVLEVSVQELSGGDGTEGKDGEGFEHSFRRRYFYLKINYKVQYL
jgi:hypothetical protein